MLHATMLACGSRREFLIRLYNSLTGWTTVHMNNCSIVCLTLCMGSELLERDSPCTVTGPSHFVVLEWILVTEIGVSQMYHLMVDDPNQHIRPTIIECVWVNG